ncbi:MAG TPA: hypothetical protein VMF89_00445 [Polyangiales bacterium]|nr:hypothetical protein [Polyangiales bacterium]
MLAEQEAATHRGLRIAALVLNTTVWQDLPPAHCPRLALSLMGMLTKVALTCSSFLSPGNSMLDALPPMHAVITLTRELVASLRENSELKRQYSDGRRCDWRLRRRDV